MVTKVKTASLEGVKGYPVTVETDIHRGLPGFNIVGLADTTIKEAFRRVTPAITNMGFTFPNEKITVNLMPASRHKDGSHFDLPIAVSIMMHCMNCAPPEDFAFLGEVSLDGAVNSICGALPLAIALRNSGIKNIILPWANAREAAILRDVNIFPVKDVLEAIDIAEGVMEVKPYTCACGISSVDNTLDFGQVIGQEIAKRAVTIAAAGGHGILMMGSPGCGKTMIAKRIPTILPDLTYEEQLEITGIYSVAGLLNDGSLGIRNRPFRSPHHTITATALIGGGNKPKPGELSLAHKGVLFLDELGEFDGRVIDVMRQPVEDGFIKINRSSGTVVFPSEVMVVIAANPCKCGNLWDEEKICTCTTKQLNSHRRKLMGPFADRIDMHIDMHPVEKRYLENASYVSLCENSESMRTKVNVAREIQKKRYEGTQYTCNGRLDENGINDYCQLDDECKQLMTKAYDSMKLTMRGYNKVLKISRTIADMEGSAEINSRHITEALMYRNSEDMNA